jgi:hypothetical protein
LPRVSGIQEPAKVAKSKGKNTSSFEKNFSYVNSYCPMVGKNL